MKKTAKVSTKAKNKTKKPASKSTSKSKKLMSKGDSKKTAQMASSRKGAHTSSGKTADSKNDIVSLILHDHKALKALIKVMKNTDKDHSERLAAFEEFAPLLITHAKPEEQTLYVFMKRDEEMRSEAFEGDVEHGLADQMLEEIERTEDQDQWSARVKVLAELAEHHIKDEEGDFLPDFKKHSSPQDRNLLGNQFLKLKGMLQDVGDTDAPSEQEIVHQPAH